MNEIENHFPNVIGQAQAKNVLNHLVASQKVDGFMPHLLIAAEKGGGKTHLAQQIGRALKRSDDPERPKPFFKINCATLKGLPQLVEDVFYPNQDREATFFFDESHEIPKNKVVGALLTVLENNSERRTQLDYQGDILSFDFSQHTFIFATTETQKMFEPLKDRMKPIQLGSYSENDLAEIMQITLKKGNPISIPKTVRLEIAKYVRRNGRAANNTAEDIKSFAQACGLPRFGLEEWELMRKEFQILPYGILPHEKQALELLREEHDMSLGQLASRLALSTQAVRKDVEHYLIRLGLIEIEGRRKLTARGHRFMKVLDGKEAL